MSDSNIEPNESEPKKPLTLDELFKDYTGTYKCQEWDTGATVGKEIW